MSFSKPNCSVLQKRSQIRASLVDRELKNASELEHMILNHIRQVNNNATSAFEPHRSLSNWKQLCEKRDSILAQAEKGGLDYLGRMDLNVLLKELETIAKTETETCLSQRKATGKYIGGMAAAGRTGDQESATLHYSRRVSAGGKLIGGMTAARKTGTQESATQESATRIFARRVSTGEKSDRKSSNSQTPQTMPIKYVDAFELSESDGEYDKDEEYTDKYSKPSLKKPGNQFHTANPQNSAKKIKPNTKQQQASTHIQACFDKDRETIKVLENSRLNRKMYLLALRDFKKYQGTGGKGIDSKSRDWSRIRYKLFEKIESCIDQCFLGDEVA